MTDDHLAKLVVARLNEIRGLLKDRPEAEPTIDAIGNELLPAWFTGRMMTDCWSFGLLTVTGQVIYIESINTINQAGDGSLWLDVTLSEGVPSQVPTEWNHFGAPTSRRDATINAAHIICAFETADT